MQATYELADALRALMRAGTITTSEANHMLEAYGEMMRTPFTLEEIWSMVHNEKMGKVKSYPFKKHENHIDSKWFE